MPARHLKAAGCDAHQKNARWVGGARKSVACRPRRDAPPKNLVTRPLNRGSMYPTRNYAAMLECLNWVDAVEKGVEARGER